MDEKFMRIALDLAKNGIGKVNPNPLVGAVIVKDNKVIGEGYHKVYGSHHAEVNAFESCSEDPTGATIYVTLEPCSHYGNTPPCVDLLIRKKVKRVVIGSMDPNPLVSGRGVKKLRECGIEVVTGVLEGECYKLNEIFMKYIVTKLPFIIMKVGMSLDGKICTKKGESKWITSCESREKVHQLRNRVSGIMVGINTVLKDDPELTCRIKYGKNPIRIIVDSKLRIPINSKIIETSKDIETIIATTINAPSINENIIKEKGAKILRVQEKNNRVDLNCLIQELGALGIDSILLEGGSELNYAALESEVVDKIQFYISPKIIGGKESKTPIGGAGIDKLKDAFKLKDISIMTLSEDILIEGYIDRGIS